MSVTLVALLALGVAVYSPTFRGAGARGDRLADSIFHLAFGLGVFIAVHELERDRRMRRLAHRRRDHDRGLGAWKSVDHGARDRHDHHDERGVEMSSELQALPRRQPPAACRMSSSMTRR